MVSRPASPEPRQRARPRVLLVTNLLSPYRIPVWEYMSEELDLVVGHFADSEPGRPVWRLPQGSPVHAVKVPALAIPVPGGEAPLYVAPGIPRLVNQVRPDAVLLGGWESPAYLQLYRAARRSGTAVCLTYGSTKESHRFSAGPIAALRRWVLRHVDSVIAYGEAAADSARHDGAPSDRVVVGFNTVDVTAMATAVRAERDRVPAAVSGHRYVYVGQLIERKNVESLIRAFAQVRQPLDRLTIVGSGALDVALRDVARQLGISDAVEFTGHLEGDELPAQLAASDTLVLPSTKEVWGLVVNEALAAGLHAVVSRDAGVLASVSRMPGVFASGTDPADLAGALERSRSAWTGPIADPPILDLTPEASAARHREAVEVAIGAARAARRIPAQGAR